jgi:hypothetical protein
MRNCGVCLGTLAFLSLALAQPAFGLRCSGKIIDNGLTKDEVRKFCGEPLCTRRPGTVFVKKSGIYWPMAADEEWVYNFGSGQFIQFIRFYQGKVVFIESGGFGWTGGPERECKDIPYE